MCNRFMKLDPQGGGWGFFGWNLIKDLRDPPQEGDDTGVLMLEEGGRRGSGQQGWNGGSWQDRREVRGGVAVTEKGSLDILTPDSSRAHQPPQEGERAGESVGREKEEGWAVKGDLLEEGGGRSQEEGELQGRKGGGGRRSNFCQ